jgi:GMC oxidoreductase
VCSDPGVPSPTITVSASICSSLCSIDDVHSRCAGVCAENLEVVQHATASKILLEGSTAVGVEYVVGNDSSSETEVVFANKEVILSAGSFGSPKILMVRFFYRRSSFRVCSTCTKPSCIPVGLLLREYACTNCQDVIELRCVLQLSGIGPAKALEELGISPLADLPVGQEAHV